MALERIIGTLDNLDQALLEATLTVYNDAKLNCPVDTGILRNSIQYRIEDEKGIVYTGLEYAPYVEYGTGIWSSQGNGRKTRWSYQDAEGNWHSTIGQKPQPFMFPALDNNRTAIADIFKKYIRGDN